MIRAEGRFADRTDAHHVLAQLPPVGGPERSHPLFVRAVENWRPRAKDRTELGGLILVGPTGTGKTTALVHLAHLLLAKDEAATSMLFVIASDLVEDQALVERAKRVKYLLLDDTGKESDPKNRLFSVLDHRHTRSPTFVSTGLSLSDLEQHYDGATVRRLFEFRGNKVQVFSSFALSKKVAAVRPPSDQQELARRMGETL